MFFSLCSSKDVVIYCIMRFDFRFIGKIIGIQIVICLLFVSDLRAATYSGCDNDKHWNAILYYQLDSCFWYHNDNKYNPSQFFTSEGTKIPNYDPSGTLRQLYEFRDTSCASKSWDIKIKGYSYMYGSETTSVCWSVGYTLQTEDETYRSSKQRKCSAVYEQRLNGKAFVIIKVQTHLSWK